MENTRDHKVVCFGEVLGDILPSGEVPSGAPMNVAYHLHKQNINPAVITRIGNNEKGKTLIDIFSAYGMRTDYFQVDYEHETGKVFTKPNEQHEVVYDILKPVVWDFIKKEDGLDTLVSYADYFVFGSLAARSPESKKTLLQLLESAKTKVLDINLRHPHYDRKIVEELLAKADFFKLNLAEPELITGWFSIIRQKFNVQNIVVTKVGDGATLYYNGYEYTHKGYKVKVVDTVSSGDAFLVGLIAKFLEDDLPEQTLDFASRMGAFIATRKRSTPGL